MSDDTPLHHHHEFADDDERRFYEQMREMPDAELLAEMRELRDSLVADDGRLAREHGMSDDYIQQISDGIANLEQAMKNEQLANERLTEAARQMHAAADRYRSALDPEYPDILDDPNEKEH